MIARDAHVLARLLAGHHLNGELPTLKGPVRSLALHLDGLAIESRLAAWQAFRCSLTDPDTADAAIAAVDPAVPMPEPDCGPSYATLADVSRVITTQGWLWNGWIASGVLNAVAAEPGTGKTRFTLDIARRLWHGLPWPDGQQNDLPPGTRTLWVQGDRNFAEMIAAARDFGIPEEAIALGSTPDDPLGGLDLDDPAAVMALGERIEAASPALVVLDTVGMVTSRNLCRPEEAREFFAPILELAGRTGVAILGLTHLSANKEALGRRIVEKARMVLKMTQPDPEGQRDRRRLWVDKTAAVKPPALGITMGDAGNDYDFTPPEEREANQGGRPAAARNKAVDFITDRLSQGDRRQMDLVNEWMAAGGSKSPIFEAFKALQEDGRIVIDDSKKPKVCHLVGNLDGGRKPDTDPF